MLSSKSQSPVFSLSSLPRPLLSFREGRFTSHKGAGMWWTCCLRGIVSASALALLAAVPSRAAGLPAYDHVVIVVEENDSGPLVYGEPSMPFLNSLANGGAKFTHSFTATTPYNVIPRGYTDPLPARGSQPNYMYLFGGNHQGLLPTWFADPTSTYNGTPI